MYCKNGSTSYAISAVVLVQSDTSRLVRGRDNLIVDAEISPKMIADPANLQDC
jgi:hypothetical protein